MTKPTLDFEINTNQLQIGPHLAVSFHRTLRIPDDGDNYPLPPSLGCFPLFRVDDYKDRVPKEWKKAGGIFFPMYQREAMWMNFGGAYPPCAVKVNIGKVNAITGKRMRKGLSSTNQDYIVVPNQPWLDGINSGDGTISQFVAMPLGHGYTVEGQVTSEEKFGGLQLVVYEPKDGKLPDQDVRFRGLGGYSLGGIDAAEAMAMPLAASATMGLGAGGQMKQDIFPDPYGVETWDLDNFGQVAVHIVNSEHFKELTGIDAPESPIDAKTYTEYGYPWFDLYSEEGDLQASETLKDVKTIKEIDEEKGVSIDNSSVEIDPNQVVHYGKDGDKIVPGY